MPNTTAQKTQARLEDFIRRAREGSAVSLDITLKKHIITEKVHPEHTPDMKGEINRYLLLGNFTFRTDAEEQTVSKVYMLGSMEEAREYAEVNRNIANQRLKIDYKRLHESGITFEEQYF